MTDPRQTLMFVGPELPVDRLWAAWLATPEADRREFLDRVRAAYLGGRRKTPIDRAGAHGR